MFTPTLTDLERDALKLLTEFGWRLENNALQCLQRHLDDAKMRPICRNCEYFDCEGKDPVLLPLEYRGDCLNPNAPGFQTGPDEKCSFFYPDSTRWPCGHQQIKEAADGN